MRRAELREALARAYDPDAFSDDIKKSTRPVAVIQWAARRKLAEDAADRVLDSDFLATVEGDALAAFELYFCDENENFLLDLSEWGGQSHWDMSLRGTLADLERDRKPSGSTP